MAAASGGAGVVAGRPHFGQVTFTGSQRSPLRIETRLVERVNAVDDVLLLTAESVRAVEAGAALAAVQCAPLFLAAATIEAVEALRSAIEVPEASD